MQTKNVFLFLLSWSCCSFAQDVDLEALTDLSGLDDQIEAVVADSLNIDSTNVVGVSTDGKTYQNDDFNDVDWAGQNMSGVTFKAVNFINSNLSDVDFSNAVFLNTDFTDTVLDGVCFYGAVFTNTDIDYGSSVKNSNFSHATFVNSDVDGDTEGVIWKGETCGSNKAADVKSNVSESNMGISSLVESNLVESNMDISNLAASNINVQSLTKANLNVSNLVRADLIKADSILMSLKEGGSKGVDLTINFATDSDQLLGKAHGQVYEIAQALKSAEMSGNRFLIQGHTDSDGEAEYNVDLSYRRAVRVSRELSEEYGVLASVLSVDGKGESQPITNNNDEQGKAINRRVTLINLGDS